MIRMYKQQTDVAGNEENQLRTREAELLSAFQTEETRWLDLMTRLEALVKR